MNILLIDDTACFIDFALRAAYDGHKVKVYMGKAKDGSRNTVGDGLVEKVNTWEAWMRWADLILISDNVRNHRFTRYFKEGYPIFSSNLEGAKWELERGVGQELFKANGIEIANSTVFSDYDKAIAFVKSTKKRYVSKPTGDADKALSYVSKSWEDMVYMLGRWKKDGKLKSPFLLQEFVPGVEMAVGTWVGRNGFSSWVLENFEFKKLMPGDWGVNTGEMGTVMRYVPFEKSLLGQKVLLPLMAEAIRVGYTGYLDVAVIVKDSDGGPMPLEVTSRFGWPLFNIQQVLHHNTAEWMLDSLKGEDTFYPKGGGDLTAAGFIMAIPPFPYSGFSQESVSGYPIWGTEKVGRNFHPAEVKLENGQIVTAGTYVCIVSGTDFTVEGAVDKAYKNVKKLIIPNSPIVRQDIGRKLEQQLPELQKRGYATDWKYK